jgi:hypothetical protein
VPDRLEALHRGITLAKNHSLFKQLLNLGFLCNILLKLQVSHAIIVCIILDKCSIVALPPFFCLTLGIFVFTLFAFILWIFLFVVWVLVDELGRVKSLSRRAKRWVASKNICTGLQ